MEKVKLKRGDIFTSTNPMALGRAIMAVEKLWSKDNDADYSHAGIITETEGITLESLWRIKAGHIDDYKGDRVLIGRWSGMTNDAFWKGMDAVSDNIGRIYPFWRLPLFIIPFAAKYARSTKDTVCSELVAEFMRGAGYPAVSCISGQNPDDIAEIIEHYKDMEIIYEGVW